MIEALLEYAVFLAKATTVVAAIGAVILIAVAAGRRGREGERIEVTHLNDAYRAMEQALRRAVLPAKQFKAEEKALKKAKKAEAEARAERRRVFVLAFRGDIKASAVASLREEITAVLTIATDRDEVVVRLDNAGGLVHEHGLAASQLLRLRARGVRLTVVVDKVAASGGYLMACIADRIVAAPFAVLGSIGVLLQLPNFHRLLDAHGVEFEQITAGEFKRTLTLFGINTQADREKMQEDIDHTHDLFKRFVAEHRPTLDLGQVATGEHWYGTRALELGLCDELGTSDDYLLTASAHGELYALRHAARKPLSQRLTGVVESVTEAALNALWRRQSSGAAM